MDIDGDEFSECDYGLVVDNGNGVQDLNSKLDTLAQAGLQNRTVSFSTIMKLYTSCSLIEKQRLVEKDEKEIRERAAQAEQAAAQQQAETEQQRLQAEMSLKQAEMDLKDQINKRDNETKLLIAQMSKDTDDGIKEPAYSQEAKDKLQEQMREFDSRLALDKERLKLDTHKVNEELAIKRQKDNKTTK